MSIGDQAAKAGEAAAGGAAVVLLGSRLCGGVRNLFRGAASRQVGALRLEVMPPLEELQAEAVTQRRWRRHVENELGYLHGALDVLLEGKPVKPARRRAPRV